MKKLLGISLVAVLAVSPLMAEAAIVDRTKSAAAAGTADATTLATTGYVKGAYNALADVIDGEGGLDSRITANANAISGETTRATGVEGTLSNLTTTAKTNLVAAINEVNSEADANAAAITVLNGDASTTGSVDKKIADALVSVNSAATTLAGRVTDAEADIDALEATVGGENSGLVKQVADLETTVGDASSGLVQDVNILKGGDTVAGSVAKAEKDARAYTDTKVAAMDASLSQSATTENGKLSLSLTEVDGVVTAISGSIAANTYDAYGAAADAQAAAAQDATTKANAAKTYADGLVNGKATETGVLATINASTVPVMASWGADSATTITVDAPSTFQQGA